MKVGNIEYNKALDLPDALAVIIVDSILILPQTYVPLVVHQAKYIQLVEDALKTDSLLGALQINNTSSPKATYDMGAVARITSFCEIGDGKLSIALEGICRFYSLKQLKTNKPYDSFMIKPLWQDFIKDQAPSVDRICSADLAKVLRSYLSTLALNEQELESELAKLLKIPSETLINGLCVSAGFNAPEQQLLLEAKDLSERMDLFSALNQSRAMRSHGIRPKDLQ